MRRYGITDTQKPVIKRAFKVLMVRRETYVWFGEARTQETRKPA